MEIPMSIALFGDPKTKNFSYENEDGRKSSSE
jgi:hypothetical protein